MNMRILLLLLIVSVVIVSTAITNNAREHSQTVGQSWSRLKAPIETADDDDRSNEDNALRHPVRLLDDDEENGNTNIRDVIRRGYDDWERFKVKHDKQFVGGDDEENERMMTFLTNRQRVRRHNEAYERGEKSFRLELNHLADLSPDEYRKMNGFLRNYGDSTARGNQSTFLAPLNVVVPDRVDWRDHGYVTEGACGSCWAFSATGALEGQHKRKTGNMVSLSEQNLVDCSSAFGNHGCNGGLMDQAFDYIKSNHGVDTETFYPYKGMNQKCHFKKSQVGADDTGFVDLPMGDEEALKVAVATQGPISVAIDAGHPTFQLYRSGVYIEPECSSMQLDHGVLVVGYGTDDVSGQDYWIVKNSWGPKWGASGYILMARNRNNQCGIATKASYPLV